ncbi:hypothetical protein MADE_000001021500 [Alteromonas mediterranea DE]|uniref:Uncharacterized protein n=1 Tax=Alteromonas mediterranea (strain DSM 17117 / CIP 110805 / LMG 28347 / Deep ecotype) TaxID=1774373 RepID=T2DKX5_ALTMD|nr:hypothetical protein MADE_000001021500 [Alteromonas mediterranea DE]
MLVRILVNVFKVYAKKGVNLVQKSFIIRPFFYSEPMKVN